MEDTSKYLIHARITADGVVERSDVVGAVFGQTEGLLGDELDLRDLQQSSKVGRIDVQIDSEHGQSFGQITITSSLDKVETAILAASLEAITRVGPCEARVEVADIEDMRAAKRREVVERAKQLLAESFDDSVMDSRAILEEVRDAQKVERISEYAGYPAGPRVADSDAIIVVEGRADVLTLLEYGIKNAIAVEGTNVPREVADLSQERTVTAFLDGDRGGDLILRELAQVAAVDYVAFAPKGKSVEDLSRSEVMDALREKAPFDTLDSAGNQTAAATDGSVHPAPTNDDSPHPDPEGPPTPDFETGEDRDTADAGVDGDSAESATTETASRTTGSVRAKSEQTSDAVGGVGREASSDSVTVDPSAVVDEIAGDEETSDGDSVAGDDEPSETSDETVTDDESGDETDTEADVLDADSSTADASATDTVEAVEDTTDENATDTDDKDGGTATEDLSDETDASDADIDEMDGDADAVDGDADAVDSEETSTAETNNDADVADTDESADTAEPDNDEPATLRGHVREVIDAGSKQARLLDREFDVLAAVPTGEAFDTLADSETEGFALVIDGPLDQRLLDVAAQRGVEQIVATSQGEFVKRPASVRVVTADQLASV